MRLVKNTYLVLSLLVTAMIIFKSVDYLSPDLSNGFLFGKAGIFGYYRWGLYAHMFGASLAFLTGAWQFLFKKSRLHRWVGMVYVLSIVFLAAPSGFYMAFYAIGGSLGTLNFAVMAVLWAYFTIQAYVAIRQKQRNRHIRFMYRSFIMTNSAILLRILMYFNNHFELIPGIEGYLIVSLASWLPALLIHETGLLLHKGSKPSLPKQNNPIR